MYKYRPSSINFTSELFQYLEGLVEKYDRSRSRIIRNIMKKMKENPELEQKLLIGELLNEQS